MVFPQPGHVSGSNRDWPETWSCGVVARGHGRPAPSCHRFFHPAVHLLIHQGPPDPVGGTARERGGATLGMWAGGVQAEVGAVGVSVNVQCEGEAGGLGGDPLYTLPTALLSLFPRRST